MAFGERNSKVVGIGGTLRGIVAPLMVGITKAWQRTDEDGLVTENNYVRRLDNPGVLAEKFGTEDTSRRAEPVGAVA